METYTPPPSDFEAPRPNPAASRPRLLAAAIALAAILGVAGGAAGDWTFSRLLHLAAGGSAQQTSVTTGAASISAPPAATGGALDTRAIALKVDPAIVDINTVVSSASGSGQGAATGLILTPGGEVLTNNHVVDGSTSIAVTIAGRPGRYNASVIGVDPAADVALIQVNGVSGLPTVKLSSARAGEAVVALGNALGKGGAPDVTEGTITGVDQSLTATDDSGNPEQLTGMLETDAGIVPGDSGGALVDSNGNVVGMITAGSAQGFRVQSAGVGYAVPVSTAFEIVSRVRSGQAGSDIILGQPGYVGVVVAELDPTVAAQLGVSNGVSVRDVQAGSPAARAGMRAGAIITTVGQSGVASVSELGTAIHGHHPGEALTLTWTDGLGTHTARLTLVGGPAV